MSNNPQIATLQKDTAVEVVYSDHPDIQVGTIGVVKTILPNGYGVLINSLFYKAGASVKETREIFFQPTHIKPCH